jgi:hypothetical protein
MRHTLGENVSAERFFDDLARTLAEPMPRRRAVRVIGASLAAVALPGIGPRLARAATTSRSQTCGGGQRLCWTAPDWVPGRPDAQPYCCPYPEQQWSCGDKDNGYKCKNDCPPVNPRTGKKQKPTWSAAKYQDGRPQKYNCCPVPQFDPVDGECVPGCSFTHGPGAHRCGKTCCPRSQRCVRSTGTCENCPPDRPVVCGSECCDRSEELCLDVRSSVSSGVRRRQCVLKCPPGKRRCIDADGLLGECCPSGFPCCGTSCGCDAGEECVNVSLDRGPRKFCRPKCRAPEKRCNYFCCTPDRMYTDRYANGRSFCRCRPRP